MDKYQFLCLVWTPPHTGFLWLLPFPSFQIGEYQLFSCSHLLPQFLGSHQESTSAGLVVDIVGSAGSLHPGNRAFLSPYPWLFAQPWSEACDRQSCFVLAAWLCRWWPASCCAPKLPFTSSVDSLPLLWPPSGSQPLFDHIRGERERSVVFLTFPVAFDSLMCCRSVCATSMRLLLNSSFFFYFSGPSVAKNLD